jgi:hypothetical protein
MTFPVYEVDADLEGRRFRNRGGLPQELLEVCYTYRSTAQIF